jgi:two-component system sensor histidine kinase KdpD
VSVETTTRLRRLWQRYLGALALVGVPTGVAFVAGLHLGAPDASLVLVLLVGIAARIWGSGPGLAAAAAAFVALNAVTTPSIFVTRPATPDLLWEWVLFTAVVVLIALQVGRLREREEVARLAQQESATLSRLTATLVPDVPIGDVTEDVVVSIRRLAGADWVALLMPDEHGALAAVSQSAVEGAETDLATAAITEYAWRNGVAVGLPRGDDAQMATGRWPASVDHKEVTGGSARRGDVALPLVASDGSVLGVLHVGSRPGSAGYNAATAGRLVLVGRLLAVFLERHVLQEDAAQAQATREAEKLRASLVSSVSHELKTPLASINATVTGLLDEPSLRPERVHAELGRVQQDVDRLNRSISDLLDFSRLETEEWRPRKDWEDLADVVGSVVADLPERDRSRVVLDLPEDPVVAEIDFVQVQRAVYHLLENALAYSPPDRRVVVSVDDADTGRRRIVVTDRGPGVTEAERTRIFEKFYRGSASAAVPHGTGLGLAIASEVVARHGGTLRVESARPEGARFVLELPGGGPQSAVVEDS